MYLAIFPLLLIRSVHLDCILLEESVSKSLIEMFEVGK